MSTKPSPKVARSVGKRKKKALKRFRAKTNLPTSVTQALVSRARGSVMALAMMLPDEHPIRFPTTEAPRTSVMGAKDQMVITTANATPTGWNLGDLLIAFYGQPARLFTAFTSLSTGTYTIQFGTTNTWTLWPTAGLAGSVEPNQLWPISGLSTNSGTPPHGSSMPFAVSGNDNFVFLNTNDVLGVTITFTSTGLTANADFLVLKYNGLDTDPTLAAEAKLTLGATGFSGNLYTATSPGHYQVKFVGLFLTAGSITTNVTSNWSLTCAATTGWLIKGMGDIDVGNSGDHNLALNARRNACSLLVTNTSALLNRQGTVVASRVRDFEPTSMTPAILARSAEKYAGDAAKGVYTFMEFTEDAQNFKSHVTDAKLPYYSLEDPDYYHFIQISCPSPNTMANTYTVTAATTLEFKSEVSRYTKDVAREKWTDLIEARGLVNSTPDWFFENPDHMRRVYEIARRAFQGAVKYGPAIAAPAAQIVKTLSPASAPAVDILVRMLQALGH